MFLIAIASLTNSIKAYRRKNIETTDRALAQKSFFNSFPWQK